MNTVFLDGIVGIQITFESLNSTHSRYKFNFRRLNVKTLWKEKKM